MMTKTIPEPAPALTDWSARMLSVMRIITALLFLEHGLMKLLHFPVPQPGVPDPLPALLVVAACVEVVGGLLLTVGLFTRLAAFVCAGQMAVGYFISHFSKSFWPGANGGSEAILYCFVFLYLVFADGGAWSVDAVRRRRCSAQDLVNASPRVISEGHL